MLSPRTTETVADLASAVLSLRPLVDRLDQPVAVQGPAALQPVLDRVVGLLGAGRFTLVPDATGGFGGVIGGRLGLSAAEAELAAVPAGAMPAVDEVVTRVAAADFDAFCTAATVRGPDGTPVRAYAAGNPAHPAVVITSACGMPARLAEAWVRHLAVDHFVLTWESRGLFGTIDDVDLPAEVTAQAGDLVAVMDHFGVPVAHVMGLCGGAVIALTAAAERPERVRSLSLWHGDFELGDPALKTDHQRNLQALMAMATTARVSAGGIHLILCESLAGSAPPDLAHLVLYPYATPVLLARYCALNGALMAADLRPLLPAITQPTLVVTSEDDVTAHPAGSRFVAAALPNARLLVAEHGDHLSLFRAAPDLLDVAARFMEGALT